MDGTPYLDWINFDQARSLASWKDLPEPLKRPERKQCVLDIVFMISIEV